MKEQGIDTTFVNWRGFFAAPGLPEDKLAAYQDAIAKMYDTPEWEEVRARNGWVNIHNSGDDFSAFLEAAGTADRRSDEEAGLPVSTAPWQSGSPLCHTKRTRKGGDVMALDRWIALVLLLGSV